MRGRLIQKFLVDIRRLDPAATEAVPGGGFNEVLGETIVVDDGSQLGTTSRRESQLLLTCQLNRDPRIGIDRMTRGGHQEDSKLEVVLYMPELENGGHLQANGKPDIHPGDRIEALMDRNGTVLIRFDGPHGMYVKNSEPAGYGLAAFGTAKINLWVLTCMPEEKGVTV